jgi:hypothetical protein
MAMITFSKHRDPVQLCRLSCCDLLEMSINFRRQIFSHFLLTQFHPYIYGTSKFADFFLSQFFNFVQTLKMLPLFEGGGRLF